MRPSSFQKEYVAVLAACACLALPARGAESDLPAGARLRLGAHRFVHPGYVGWLGFAAGDRQIFSLSDAALRRWDLESGRCVWSLPPDPERTPTFARTAAGGTVLVLAAGRHVGWMRADDPTSLRWMAPAAKDVRGLAVSADGKTVATHHEDGIRIWSVARGEITRRIGTSVGARGAIALSTNGGFVAGGVTYTSAGLWEAASGRPIATWDGAVHALAFAPHRGLLAACLSSKSGILRPGWTSNWSQLFELSRSQPRWKTGHRDFDEFQFSPDGSLLAARASDTIQILDAASGEALRHIGYIGGLYVSSVAFSNDGTLLASGGGSTRIRFWRTDGWVEWRPGTGHEGPVRSVAFSPDGKRLATGGTDGSLRLWSPATGDELRTIADAAAHGPVVDVAFAPDARHIAISGSAEVAVWNVESGKAVLSTLTPRGRGLSFLPGSRDLLTSMDDGSMGLWSLDTGQLVRRIGKGEQWLGDLRLLGDGLSAAWIGEHRGFGIRDLTTGEDSNMLDVSSSGRLWIASDGSWLVNGRESRATRTGEVLGDLGHVNATAMSPDGRFVASAGAGEIHVWEHATRRHIHSFQTGTYAVHGLAFSPDGTTLASAGHDGDVLLWDFTGESGGAGGASNLAKAWMDLMADDGWTAHQAAWRLARGGPAAVAWLSERLRPATPPVQADVAVSRMKLRDPDFDVRDLGARALVDSGLSLSPEEIQALRRPLPDPTHYRPGNPRVPTEYGPPPVLLPLPDRLQKERAIAALERFEGPEADALLERLASGLEGHPQTRCAQEALRRRARR